MTSARTQDPVSRMLGPSMSAAARRVLSGRCRVVLDALDAEPAGAELVDVARALEVAVGSSEERLWLARSVIGASLPTDEEFSGILATFLLDGLWQALSPVIERLRTARSTPLAVTVVRGMTTIDVGNTAASTYLSGIQRVVRETCLRWRQRPDAVFVSWSESERYLRRLTAEEHENLFGDEPDGALDGVTDGSADIDPEMLVPWQGTHVVPELVAGRLRTPRLLTLNRYAECQVSYVGFDCVPILCAETVGPSMTTLFSRNLAAIRHADRVATISKATADEYLGWRGMCHGRGPLGPEVTPICLPVEAQVPDAETLDSARRLLRLHDDPVVLVVGSHEPRKNHLAVLHAAELLWREGHAFTLAMVGAGAWRAEAYERAVGDRIGAGRPLLSIRGLPDDLLWAAYHVADFTVFPSLHEGFGLPVAESLAAGTPAITSNFGSMREIVAPEGTPLGGLLVDPRSDRELADAMRALLTDHDLRDRLVAETRMRPQRTWDDYASELWDYLVGGRAPSALA